MQCIQQAVTNVGLWAPTWQLAPTTVSQFVGVQPTATACRFEVDCNLASPPACVASGWCEGPCFKADRATDWQTEPRPKVYHRRRGGQLCNVMAHCLLITTTNFPQRRRRRLLGPPPPPLPPVPYRTAAVIVCRRRAARHPQTCFITAITLMSAAAELWCSVVNEPTL